MNRSLSAESLQQLAARLELAHKTLGRRYPGFSGERRPVHVVYGGAHLFKQSVVRRMRELALRSLDEFAPDFTSFAKAVGLPGSERLPGSAAAASDMAE